MGHMTTTAKAATIQGLLAKAASSEFPDEAVAFRDKAFALMAKFAITQAMVDAADPSKAEDLVAVVRTTGSGPYVNPKRQLATDIAYVFGVKVVFFTGITCATVQFEGFRSDVDRTLELYDTLHMQMVLDAKEVTGVSNRRTFMFAWAQRVAARLALKFAEAVTASDLTPSVTSTEIVMVDRRQRVDDWFNARHGKLHTIWWSVSHYGEAAVSGRKAADTADISGGRNHVGTQGQIG